MSLAVANTRRSGDELHRNGVQSLLSSCLQAFQWLIGHQGARGHEQRAMGGIVHADAGNRQWHLQLVRAILYCAPSDANLAAAKPSTRSCP